MGFFTPGSFGGNRPAGARDGVGITVQVVHEISRHGPDVGPVTATRDAGWTLNPRAPFCLTLTGTTGDVAQAVRAILDDPETMSRDKERRLLGLLLHHNFRMAELDTYLATWRPRVEADVARRLEAHPEWATASGPDREDIRAEVESAALAAVPVRLCDDLRVLFMDEPADVTTDDALLARYPFDLLHLYVEYANTANSVLRIPADDFRRQAFDQLVEVGLARRGTELDLEAVLETLTLKDMADLVNDLEHPRFTRRAKATAWLLERGDLRERIARRVSLRERFQLCDLPSEVGPIDLAELGRAWRWAQQVCRLLEVTWYGNRAAMAQLAYEDALTWEVALAEDCCPACVQNVGQRVIKRSSGTLGSPVPAHLGCTCRLDVARMR
jgi:hypothetical protein